jgi:hypothetical protein
MRDIRDPRLLWLKGGLFLGLGIASGILLLQEARTLRILALLLICIWAFCRAYYFAFYVVEHYVDPQYKFSGLFSLARYLWGRKK